MEQQNLNKVSTKSQRLVSYENGKIYKVVSSKGDKVYIGSTTQKYLSQRFSQHTLAYKYYKLDGAKRSSVVDLFDEYGIESCSIELIDYCPCKSKTELERQEFMFINSMPCVNKQKIFQRDFISEVATNSQQVSTNSQQVSTHSQQESPAESKDRLIESKLCLNREFLHRSFFPIHKYNFHNALVDIIDRSVPSIHKYNMHSALVDIRDIFSPSADREHSHLNCVYFHTSLY